MDAIFFLLRYTPWWAIPIILICTQFAYIYWLKDLWLYSYAFVSLAGISFLTLVFYVYAGSPDNAARFFDEFMRNFLDT